MNIINLHDEFVVILIVRAKIRSQDQEKSGLFHPR